MPDCFAATSERRAITLEAEVSRLETLTAEQQRRIAELEGERSRMADLAAVQFQRIAELEAATATDAASDHEAPTNLSRRITNVFRRAVPKQRAMEARAGALAAGARHTRSTTAETDWELARRSVQESGLFDAEFYRIDNPDVALSGVDPLDHYLTAGWRTGRRPCAGFDLDACDASRSEVAEVEPITRRLAESTLASVSLPHLTRARALQDATVKRVRDSGLFDARFYTDANPIVQETGIDPVLHYVVSGHRAFLDPSAELDAAAFRAAEPAFRDGTKDLVTYLLDHRRNPRAPEFAHLSAKRWVFSEHPYRLPDESVRLVQVEGTRYFARYGFRAEPDGWNRLVVRAAAELAARQPGLSIDQDAPDASIIVPVHGQAHFALACLDALASHASRFSAEILLVDDASPEATQVRRLSAIPWVSYVRRPENGGFIAACNDGAARARGRVIVFLNSDTRVVPGWLDELMESFRTFPKAGLVGSKLYDADGGLQEAGCILWRDGSAWNYGRGADPNDPRYCFARRVDYCSGASIGVTRAAWTRAGGFDEAFAPAYCEDADLALRLRRLGFETWFQPLSRVIHYEGMTHGRDTASGIKAYQVAHLKRLFERHGSALAGHREAGSRPDAEALRAHPRRLLVIDAETPRPDRDSGSDQTVRIMDVFRGLGYDLVFVPQSNFLYGGRYADALSRMGVELSYAPFRTRLSDLLDAGAHGVGLCLVFRYGEAVRALDLLRERLPVCPVIFHNVDMHYARERREAALTGDQLKRIVAERTMTDELSVSARVDATIVTNVNERDELAAMLDLRNVVAMPYVAEISASDVPFSARSGVLFLGGFRHPPNGDAVRYFLGQIWPRLKNRLPEDAVFMVIGPDAPADLVEAAEADARVRIIGHVEDLKPWFDCARVLVAPLRFGAGVKGKVMHGLRHGLPAVVTGVAADGVGLRAEEHVLITDEPEDFADAVARLHGDPVLWSTLQAGGYRFIEEIASIPVASALCEEAIEVACATWIARAERQRARILRRLTRI